MKEWICTAIGVALKISDGQIIPQLHRAGKSRDQSQDTL